MHVFQSRICLIQLKKRHREKLVLFYLQITNCKPSFFEQHYANNKLYREFSAQYSQAERGDCKRTGSGAYIGNVCMCADVYTHTHAKSPIIS